MNIKKILFIGLLFALLFQTDLIEVNAENNMQKIKDYLLLNQALDGELNYNVNNDKEVNVLDLCRMKNEYFKPASAAFVFGSAEIDYNNLTLRIPLNVINNTTNIMSVQLNLNYDSSAFSLKQIDNTCDGGSWIWSEKNKCIQFSGGTYYSISYNGTVSYIEFNILPNASAGNYQFFMSNIECYASSSYGQTRTLSKNECPERSDVLYASIHEMNTVTTTVTLPVTKEYKTGTAVFTIDTPVSDIKNKKITIPVKLENNTIGISSVLMHVNYDQNAFSMQNVSAGNLPGNWSMSENKADVKFFSNNNIKDNGIIGYIELSISSSVQPAVYSFSLSAIDASTQLSDGAERKLTKDECPSDTETITVKIENTDIITTPVTTSKTESVELLQIEREVLSGIIAWRKETGLPDFTINDSLCKCAQIRAQDLSELYGEDRPDGSTIDDLLYSYNVPNYYNSCEFRSKGITSSSKLISVFKRLISQNPGHAVEDPDYSYIGVGYYNGYWSVILT